MKLPTSNILFIALLTVIMFIFLILIILPEKAVSQPPIPGSPDQTPIDGGLSALAALGGAYAIKKLRDKE